MRQGGPNGRRPRGRHHGGGNGMGGNNGGGQPNMGGGNRPRSAASLRHQTFDSNGPDVRVRGNAWQVYEKYQSLARDAASSGDRIAAENYQQHAEHYYRIIEAINEALAVEQAQRGSSVPYGQQPEMPANYYAPDGSLIPSASQPPVALGAEDNNSQPAAQAEVQPRHVAPTGAFLASDPMEESNGPQPLAASGR